MTSRLRLGSYVSNAGAAYAALAREWGEPEADLITAPYVLAGTVPEIVAKLRDVESRRGITRYAVRAPAIDVIAQVQAAY